MRIRHLIVAALAASAACAAHADVIPSSSGNQSGFLSGWITGNGTDVLASGVLGNLNLIGGISHGAASKASGKDGAATLAEVLLGKASASLGKGDNGQTKLVYKQGVDGMYLMGAGNGILAAVLGNGVSVIGSSDGVVVTSGSLAGGGSLASGGAATGGSAGGTSGSTGGGSGGGSGSGSSGTSSGGSTGGSTGTSTGGSTGTSSGGTTGGTPAGAGGSADIALPVPVPQAPLAVLPAKPAADVPEPSSIALMLAGMLGAGALSRRRRT